MSEIYRKMHRNAKQDEIFISFMTEHPKIAKEYVKGDRVENEALWNKLAEELNLYGPPVKSVKDWKKIWQGWKTCIRRKLSHNRAETNATGGGEYNQVMLSQNEKTVAVLSGMFKAVDGIQDTNAFGAPCSTEKYEDILLDTQIPKSAVNQMSCALKNINRENSTEESEDVFPDTNMPKAAPNQKQFKKQCREKQINVASLVHDEVTALNEISSKLETLTKVAEKNALILQSLCKLFEEANIEARRHNQKMETIAIEQNELTLMRIEKDE